MITDIHNKEKNIIQTLNSDYKIELNKIPQDKLLKLSIQAIETRAYNNGDLNNNCERIRQNCITIAATEAVLEHIGCAFIDAIGVGILCHAAVITRQVVQSDTCNAEAENCRNGR